MRELVAGVLVMVAMAVVAGIALDRLSLPTTSQSARLGTTHLATQEPPR